MLLNNFKIIVIFSDLLICSSLIGTVSQESDDSGHSQSEEDSYLYCSAER